MASINAGSAGSVLDNFAQVLSVDRPFEALLDRLAAISILMNDLLIF